VGRSETVPRSFVCEISDVDIVGAPPDGRNAHAVFLTADRDIIVPGEGGFDTDGGLYTHWLRNHLTAAVKAHGVRRLFADGWEAPDGAEYPHFDAACPLVGMSCLTYGHWMLNYLPRLQGLARYEAETGVSPTLLIHPASPDWMVDSLTALGFAESRIEPWTHDRAVVETLVVPAPRYVHIHPDEHEYLFKSQQEQACPVFAPSSFEWMRRTAAANLNADPTGSERVYVSRHEVEETTDFKNKRVVRNEDDVMELLTAHGFERVFPAQLSIAEQVRLFADAEIVVGPCGSALDNIIFGERATVVELFGEHTAPDMVGPYQYAAASACDLNYGFLIGESVGNDIRIDTDRLQRLLDTLVE
jgi:capsular polysaccharide biosynthesis protein